MTFQEAVEILSDGHTIVSEETTKQLCELLGIPYPDELVLRWKNQKHAIKRYGFAPYLDVPGSGVYTLRLSYYVARAVGIDVPPGNDHIGRGSQARANAQAIAEKLGVRG